MTKILIPAMDKRSSLEAARSLGKRGFEVVGCSHTRLSSGFFSKYCRKKYLYCSPLEDANKYVDDIKRIIDMEKPDIFFPINEETLIPVLRERDYFEKKLILPLPSNETIEQTLDKVKTLKLAESLGIPCPKTVKDFKKAKYPLIARPRRSRELVEGKIIGRKLYYAFSSRELTSFSHEDFFVQEYIPGRGYGFYAILDHGKPKAYFMMQRINEVPFTGGPSSLRESFYDQWLEEYGLKILKELKWHGAAMVEFRKDVRDNEFKFIEINPRLWGSLALSVYSGIDFPYLLAQLAPGKEIKEQFDYDIGVRARWLFGDISYLGSVLFGRKVDWRPSRMRAILDFFKFFGKDLHYDYFQSEDLVPSLAETLFSLVRLIKKIL